MEAFLKSLIRQLYNTYYQPLDINSSIVHSYSNHSEKSEERVVTETHQGEEAGISIHDDANSIGIGPKVSAGYYICGYWNITTNKFKLKFADVYDRSGKLILSKDNLSYKHLTDYTFINDGIILSGVDNSSIFENYYSL